MEKIHYKGRSFFFLLKEKGVSFLFRQKLIERKGKERG